MSKTRNANLNILAELSFRNFQDEYKRKNKKNYAEDCEKAAKGDDKALIRLVKMSKVILNESFTHQRIIKAASDSDKDFFKALGDAVASKAAWPRPSRKKDQRLADYIAREFVPLGFDLCKRGAVNKLRIKLYDALSSINLPEDHSWWSLVNNPDYFDEFCKRYGLKTLLSSPRSEPDR